ncbi:MAG: alpha-N-arabinofuranosidase, partial [Massilia sp.]
MKHFHLLFLAAALSAAMSVRAAPAVDIEIDAGRPGAVINKHLYGQAVGQSGAGIWVGPDSTIPNIKGWRKDVVGALKALRVPLLRWPAGCVAEEYDWRDGVGARDGRPAPLLPRGAGGANNNALGTHEFFELVELLGADAYVNGNIGTGSAREAAEWVEYMVADGASTLAQLRAKNGHARPYKLAYFGVGAAPWSCGGNMSAQYYADLYNQFAVFIRGKVDQPPRLVAAGDGADWTAELSTKKRIRDYRFDISAHDDAAAPGGAPAPGAASAEQQWIAVLQRTLRVNNFIDSNVAVLDKNDAANKMSLALGDWGGADARAPQRQDALGD